MADRCDCHAWGRVAASGRGRQRALAAALPLMLVAGACTRGPGVPRFPNAPVILISIDTLRADHLPAYGYTKVRTPNLDRLQAQTWFFEHAYTPCPMTLPAHTTMLTGQLPPEHGARNNAGFVFDGKSHPNLPALLKQHGYAAGAAVSSYVLRFETGLGDLFDYYEDSVETAPGVESVHYRRAGDKTEAFARDWIAKHASAPFFFFFHIYEPHLPYEPPEPFRSEYGVTYEAEIATADAIVGSFIDDLKRLGVFDRALVIVTGDHGEGLGDHGEEQHSILLYLETLHVPLFVKLPDAYGAGRRVSAPVQLSDIMPTVTAVLGIETPKGVSGSSLLSAGAGQTPERVIYGETLYPRLQLGWSDLRSVIDTRFHYISGPRPELYDIVADPHERSDVARTEQAAASRLAAALQKFPKGNESPSPVDQETLRRLAALGYVGGLRDRGEGALPNPMDSMKYLDRMQQAWRDAADRKYPQAIAALRAIVSENPGMSDAWIKLGELYSEVGFDEQSAAAYKQALDRSPVFLPDIEVAWGFVLLRLKRFDDAEACGRRTLGLVPTKAHELLARVAMMKGDLPAAESEANSAAGSRNPQPSAILVMAEVKLRAGKPEEALAAVSRAEAYARDLRLKSVYDLEFLRGDSLARMNRVAEAEAAFRREIAAFPDHAQAYANLAVLRLLQRDRSGFESIMDEMARANASPRTYLLGALTFEAFGQKEKAAEWRRRSETLEKQ